MESRTKAGFRANQAGVLPEAERKGLRPLRDILGRVASKRGVMHVRTPAGVKKYGLPIGTVIKARPGQSLKDAAKALKAVIDKRGVTNPAEIRSIAANPVKGDKLYSLAYNGTYQEYVYDGKMWTIPSITGADGEPKKATPQMVAKAIGTFKGKVWATKADPSKSLDDALKDVVVKPDISAVLDKVDALDPLAEKPKPSIGFNDLDNAPVGATVTNSHGDTWLKYGNGIHPEDGGIWTASGGGGAKTTGAKILDHNEIVSVSKGSSLEDWEKPLMDPEPEAVPTVGSVVKPEDLDSLPVGTEISWKVGVSAAPYVKGDDNQWHPYGTGAGFPVDNFVQGAKSSVSGVEAKIVGYNQWQPKKPYKAPLHTPKHAPVKTKTDESKDISSHAIYFPQVSSNKDPDFPILSYTGLHKSLNYTDKLPESSTDRIGYYTGAWAGEVNGSLRAGHTPHGVKEMDQAFRPLDEPAMFFRTVPTQSVGVGMKDTAQEVFDDLKKLEGKSITDKGFMSTSYDLDGSTVQGNPFFVLRIRAPKGTPAILAQPWSDYQSEHEVILPRDMPLKVNHVEWNRSEMGSNTFILDVTAQPDLIPEKVKKSMAAAKKSEGHSPGHIPKTTSSAATLASLPVGTQIHEIGANAAPWTKHDDGLWWQPEGSYGNDPEEMFSVADKFTVMPEVPEHEAESKVEGKKVPYADAASAPVGSVYHTDKGDGDWVKQDQWTWKNTSTGHTLGEKILFSDFNNVTGTLEKPQSKHTVTPGKVTHDEAMSAPVGTIFHDSNGVDWIKKDDYSWQQKDGSIAYGPGLLFGAQGTGGKGTLEKPPSPPHTHKAYVPETNNAGLITLGGIKNAPVGSMLTNNLGDVAYTKTSKEVWTSNKTGKKYQSSAVAVAEWKPDQFHNPDVSDLVAKPESSYEKAKAEVLANKPKPKYDPYDPETVLDALGVGGVVTDKDGVVWVKNANGYWYTKPPAPKKAKTSKELAKQI